MAKVTRSMPRTVEAKVLGTLGLGKAKIEYYDDAPKGGGESKGYQGQCWRSGKTGQKAKQCEFRNQEVVDVVSEKNVKQLMVRSMCKILNVP